MREHLPVIHPVFLYVLYVVHRILVAYWWYGSFRSIIQSNPTKLAQCPTYIPRAVQPPLRKWALSSPPLTKEGAGRIPQQGSQCPNVMGLISPGGRYALKQQ